MRMFWVILLLAMISLLSACPQPIEQTEDGDELAAGEPAAPGTELEINMIQPDGADDAPASDPVAEDDTVGLEDVAVPDPPPSRARGILDSLTETFTGRGSEPEEIAVPGDAVEEPVAPEDDPIPGDVIDEPVEVDPVEPETPPAAPDADRMLGADDASADDEPGFEEPPARVSRESVAFAGEWVTVVINQDGRAREIGNDGTEWRFNLADDGHCQIIQQADGDEWEQAGGWEFVGTELTLNLGPGGQRVYAVDQPRDGVAVLSDTATNAVLFCLRVDEEEEAPMLLRHYDSDFGAVEFRQSGQAYWKGTYGEPEGTLLVHILGTYIVGTWEQQPGRGFALLELTTDGFDGWWWYETSTEFDGTWRGGKAG